MRAPATALTCVLLLDAALITVHLLSARLWAGPFDPAWLVVHPWRVDADRGFAELFQYLKYGAAATLAVGLYRARSQRSGLVLALFAALLLFDDASQLHERLGAAVSSRLALSGHDAALGGGLSELLGFLGLGAVFVWYLLSAWRGPPGERRVARGVGLLVAVLIFFGAGVDLSSGLLVVSALLDLAAVAAAPLLEAVGAGAPYAFGAGGVLPTDSYLARHWPAFIDLAADPGVASALTDLRLTKVLTTVIEEGGEMVTMSLLVAYLLRATRLPRRPAR